MLVATDTKYGFADLVKPFKVRRNYTYLIVIDTEGKEVLRIERIFHLKDSTKKQVEQAWKKSVWGRQEILHYALSYEKVGQVPASRVSGLVSQLGSVDFSERETAAKKLLAIGEAGRRQLADFKTDNEEVRWRIQSIMTTWNSLNLAVERDGLDHNIAYLSQHAVKMPQVANRLASILPKTVEGECAMKWWKANQHRYWFDRDSQQYVTSVDKNSLRDQSKQ